MAKINFAVSEIVEIYNSVPKILANKIVKVTVKLHQSQTDAKTPIFLTEQRNGNYWIVATEDETYWLFPKSNLLINQFNQETVKSLFDCQEYHPSDNSEFILIQPAKVSLLPNGKEWKLEEKGSLNFDPNFPSLQLRSQLKQTQKEREELQSELEQKKSNLPLY